MPKDRLGRDPFAGLTPPEETPRPKKKAKRARAADRNVEPKPTISHSSAEPALAEPPPPPPEPEARAARPTAPSSSVFAALRELAGMLGMGASPRGGGGEAAREEATLDNFARPILDFLFDRYFRVTSHGLENIPPAGRVLLVANHAGALPFDALLLRRALERHGPPERAVRVLGEAYFQRAAMVFAPVLTRLGILPASPERALRLLDREACLCVFPEGMRGLAKPPEERHRVQRLGRGGFARVALRAGAPIVPVALVSSDTPGGLPLPTQFAIHCATPIDTSRYGPDAAEDAALLAELSEQVRERVQETLDRALAMKRVSPS